MEPNLLPKEIIEFSAEYQLARISKKTNIIYIISILSVVISLLSLPFIPIDISVKSPGILKAATETSVIKSLSNGTVAEVLVKENDFVTKGQVILKLESPSLEERRRFYINQLKQTENFISDLMQLTTSKEEEKPLQLSTSMYTQAFDDYEQKMAERIIHFKKISLIYDRNKKLHTEKVIADAEFEGYTFEFAKAQNDIDLLRKDQINAWHQQLQKYEREKQEFENELRQIHAELEHLIVKASVSGSIQNLAGLYRGSVIFANQEIGQISPDTFLIAEIYVSPNDIAYLHEKMSVRMQIGALNYNQWGLLNGVVHEISSDIHVLNEKPVFKVTCRLAGTSLRLRNGYEAKLKKGMTLQGRFIITKRTLWQLLYDRVDDWINPNTTNYSFE